MNIIEQVSLLQQKNHSGQWFASSSSCLNFYNHVLPWKLNTRKIYSYSSEKKCTFTAVSLKSMAAQHLMYQMSHTSAWYRYG